MTDAAVDGWVIYSIGEDHPFVQAALARHAPVVILDQPLLPGVPRVEVDSAGGTRMATEHLLGLGHRNLVVLSLPFAADGRSGLADLQRQDGATYGVTRRRLAGALAAAAASGIPETRVTVVECAHNDPASAAATLAPFLKDVPSGEDASFLEDGPRTRPTAVVAMSDQLAFGAMRAARTLGLRVPDDLSVVGFDDVAAAATSDPPLTTVRQPLEARGRAAGALILDLLHGQTVDAVTTFPVELVIRASTTHPAT